MAPKYLDNFLDILASIDSKDQAKRFAKIVLTPEELKAIPLRLEIIHMIEQGVPQREISKKLGVGIATVTRGSKEYKNNKSWWKDFSAWRNN